MSADRSSDEADKETASEEAQRPAGLTLKRTVVLVLLGIALSIVIYNVVYANVHREALEVRSSIRKELPPGTERRVVEKWLKDRGISFGDLTDSDGKRVGLAWSMRLYMIDPFQTKVRFDIYFDEQDRLIELLIHERSLTP